MDCGTEFERDKPGPVVCPAGHLYIDWVNYEEWIREFKTRDVGKMADPPDLGSGNRGSESHHPDQLL